MTVTVNVLRNVSKQFFQVRALDVIKNHDNVVSFDWFLRISRDIKSSISFHPWELLSKSKNRPDPLEYDMYFDYYYQDATVSTLKHSFARIDKLVILKVFLPRYMRSTNLVLFILKNSHYFRL